MAEETQIVGTNRNRMYWLISGALMVVAVLLIICIGPKSSESPAETGDTQTPDTALHVVQPVVAGDYEYMFSGVHWIFDTESPEVVGTDQTWVKLEFADFTRNGNAIAFGRPYKLGVHPGTCAEVQFIDTSELEGIPFSYAKCSGAGTTHEFVVLQQLEKVVVFMRETKVGVEPVWKDWYDINVTEIVK